MVEISDIGGLWHRSLIVHANGSRDTTTWVGWMQGPSLFVDLRVPADRPNFQGVRCRSDLSHEHVAWLARQEGFAGRLDRDGSFFVWRRILDFQPPALAADAGSLHFEGTMLIEEGRHVPYLEHWHQQQSATAHCGAVRLHGVRTRGEAFIVRCGQWFAYARSPGVSLTAGTTLAESVADTSSLRAAQDIVDCEISFGTVASDRWTITRSSLPYREGARLDPQLSGTTCRTLDTAAHGDADVRDWNILELEGDGAALSVGHQQSSA